MEITQNIFKKIILLNILLFIIIIPIEIIIETTNPLYTNYDVLDDKLHQGYLLFIKGYISIIILSIWASLYFVGIGLLYFLKSVGRPLYLLGIILNYVLKALDGDGIYYGLTFIITDFTVFLDFFILYLIYLSPFKKEFEKKT